MSDVTSSMRRGGAMAGRPRPGPATAADKGGTAGAPDGRGGAPGTPPGGPGGDSSAEGTSHKGGGGGGTWWGWGPRKGGGGGVGWYSNARWRARVSGVRVGAFSLASVCKKNGVFFFLPFRPAAPGPGAVLGHRGVVIDDRLRVP